MNIACVLRSGGEYGPSDVVKLHRGFARHLGGPADFYCLTDLVEDADIKAVAHVVPLVHDWPTWFAKLELFRPYTFRGPTFYADLDSIVLQDIADDLHLMKSQPQPLLMLKDRRRPELTGSGLMFWKEPRLLDHLYATFAASPEMWMHRHRQMPKLGDQSFCVETMARAGQRIGLLHESLHASLNTDDEATCRAAAIAVCSYQPKLPEMAREDGWRGELVRSAWL
jgi:hypothetical protein